MRKLFLLGMALLAFPARAHASEPLFASEPLDDDELEAARGGFTLPGGIEIGFGAEIATSVGGQLRLLTSMQITDQGVVASYSHPDGTPMAVEGGGTGSGVTNITIPSSPGTNVTVSVEQANLFIQHTVGNLISSLVVNTADNQVIDSQLTINLQLDNVTPLAIGSGAFQIESLGLDAASFRAP